MAPPERPADASGDARPRAAGDRTPESSRGSDEQTSARHRSDVPSERSASENPPSLRTMELEALHAQRSFLQEQQQYLAEARLGLSEAIAALDDARLIAAEKVADSAAELAILVAKRVVGREVTLDRAVVRGLIAEGLHALAEHEPLRVDLGPGFAPVVEDVKADLALRGVQAIVHVDEELTDFGCMIRNDLGSVDESIETRLAVLLSAVRTEQEG